MTPRRQSLESQRSQLADAKEEREIHRKHAALVIECHARASRVRARAAPSERRAKCLLNPLLQCVEIMLTCQSLYLGFCL